MKTPLRAAIIGMGGFARHHHEALCTLENEGLVQLLATCEPQPERFALEQERWDFAARGVRVYAAYLDMLDAHQLDFVCIPTPIPLHAPMHRACVERKMAVYLEKPPTLNYQELDAMLEVEKRARFATQVGFNFIVEEARQGFKRRLVAGEFGRLRRAVFLGHWPRSAGYFERAPWAGRLVMGDDLVLDSCAGNALAHYVHNLLFWCGSDEILSWGEVGEVEAQLYRAHAIESFDTAFARGKCGDVEFRLAATHAGDGAVWQREWFECDDARVAYASRGGSEIHWHDGRRERGETSNTSTVGFLLQNLRHYAHYLRGERERPLTRLVDSRPFVHLNDLLFIASGEIATIPETHLRRQRTEKGEESVAIEEIEALMENFGASGLFPHQSGAAWSHTGGRATPADLPQLRSVVLAMRDAFASPVMARYGALIIEVTQLGLRAKSL